MNSIFLSITPKKGKSIGEVCSDVKELSEFLKEDITFSFNGVSVTTQNQSIMDMIASYNVVR